jgi:hypothetical protein
MVRNAARFCICGRGGLIFIVAIADLNLIDIRSCCAMLRLLFWAAKRASEAAELAVSSYNCLKVLSSFNLAPLQSNLVA